MSKAIATSRYPIRPAIYSRYAGRTSAWHARICQPGAEGVIARMGRDILDSTRSLAFLEKPFSAEGLVAKVREVLGH